MFDEICIICLSTVMCTFIYCYTKLLSTKLSLSKYIETQELARLHNNLVIRVVEMEKTIHHMGSNLN